MSFNICIVGTGYVGIVSGSTFAETGNNVICVDIDANKVEKMKKGISPIYEPGLDHLLQRNIKENRLNFTTDLKSSVLNSAIVFLCLPTPPSEDGSADLQHVMKVARDIANILKESNNKDFKILVNKSTVPVGTASKVKAILDEVLGTEHNVHIASNPEFLREGFAIEDALKPERVVVGTSNDKVAETMRELYAPFLRSGNPIYVMDEKSAEVTKYAANAFLAVKISYMNELSAYCETVGADIEKIRMGIGSDSRIGKRFLFAGVGYGGSCFPKDVKAIIHSSEEFGSPLEIIKAAHKANETQQNRFFERINNYYSGDLLGKTFAIWGLAFKPNTDDVREAPAFSLIEKLLSKGAKVVAYDQEAMENTKLNFGDRIDYAEDMYECLKNADSLAIVTEWNVFRNPDFDRIKGSLKSPVIFDGRNLFEPDDMKDLGFQYYCIGRK